MSTNERTRAKVLAVLREANDDGSSMGELVHALGSDAPARKELRQILKRLTRSGEVVRVDRDLYTIAGSGPAFEGVLRFAAGQFYVDTDDGRIAIPDTALGAALSGDRVRGTVQIAGPQPAGTIESIVDELAPRTFDVQLSRFRGLWLGSGPQVDEPVQLSGTVDGRAGDRVRVEVVGRRTFKRGAVSGIPSQALTVRMLDAESRAPSPARVPKEQLLRFVDSDERNARTVLDQLASGLGVDAPFEDRHEAEAAQATAPATATEAGVDDLTHVPFATIDGADAKDFDDAVFAEPGSDDVIRLWVAVADVSSYVEEGGALDDEARRRGCSVYVPGRVYPMLPFHLADDVCSLRPDELRRCAWVRMEIDANGQVIDRALGFGIMCSRARMTYAEVHRILNGEESERQPEIITSVRLLDQLRKRLYQRRVARGMLDLELPEPQVALSSDGARVEGMHMHPRYDAHRLIEECMLVTNETVADFLVDAGWPAIFRVHGEPNPTKLRQIQVVLREVADGAVLPATPSPRDLGKIFDKVAGTPLSRVISWVVLRTLPRAEYAVDRTGHYGLGATRYLHFTSPIRRYPDLEVHRLVRRALASGRAATKEEREALVGRLSESASKANDGEGIQTTAERWSDRMLRALYMVDHVGDEFDAIISDVMSFGVFVSIEEPYVEGLIPIRSLGDDYFIHDDRRSRLVGERSATSFQIGDPIRVVCVSVDTREGRINFEPAERLVSNRRKRRPVKPRPPRGRRPERTAGGRKKTRR